MTIIFSILHITFMKDATFSTQFSKTKANDTPLTGAPIVRHLKPSIT